MATRSGSVDPGLLLWLMQRNRLSTADLGEGLEHASGLTGLAGTADMREVLARADAAMNRPSSRSMSISTACGPGSVR